MSHVAGAGTDECLCVQRFIAKHFAAHPALVKGMNVIEFGAASYVPVCVLRLFHLPLDSRAHCACRALPSLVALHENAAVVMMTGLGSSMRDCE